MTLLFNQILYQPLFNFLVYLYNVIPGNDFGVAIIVLTLIVRVIFTPFSIKMLVSQRRLSELQPKIKEIQEKFKHDKVAQSQAVMELYKKEGVNPMSGCLPLIIQLPLLFALYKALANGLNPENLGSLYSFIHNPGQINNIAFGFLDLAKKSPFLSIAAGAFQMIQSKISAQQMPLKDGGNQAFNMAMMNKHMLYFFPIMIIIISWNLPAGLVLYWAVTTFFSIFEQLYIKKKWIPKNNQ